MKAVLITSLYLAHWNTTSLYLWEESTCWGGYREWDWLPRPLEPSTYRVRWPGDVAHYCLILYSASLRIFVVKALSSQARRLWPLLLSELTRKAFSNAELCWSFAAWQPSCNNPWPLYVTTEVLFHPWLDEVRARITGTEVLVSSSSTCKNVVYTHTHIHLLSLLIEHSSMCFCTSLEN